MRLRDNRRNLHYRLLKYCFYALLLLLNGSPVFSQADTSFWFVAPDLQQEHGDRPIYLRISSQSNAATVTISQPANSSFPVQTVSIAANSSLSIDLTSWIDLLENQPVNTVLNKGLHIRSTSKISCYYDVANGFNGDMFALKGRNALGKKFTIPFQQSFSTTYAFPNYTSTFEIVATQNNTTVTILPARNLMGHPSGVSFTVTLNKGQTYSCAAESNSASERPGGTIITSDKPVAVSIKDDSIIYPGFGCADTAGDQLIPDAIAGTEFVIIKGYLNGADNYFVFATENSTSITENGTVVATLNAGQYYTGTLNADACFVESSKPAQVFHVSGFGCEIGGAVIPSVKCTGSNTTSLTRATTQNFFINIITKPSAISGFTLNGQTGIITASQFQVVPGSGGAWMYARVLLDLAQVSAGGIAKIDNNIEKFHVGLIHGDQNSTCRYGYFSEFGNSSVHFLNFQTTYCKNSDVTVTAVSPGSTSFDWEGPNGFVASGATLTINNFQPWQEGYYKITAAGNICGLVTDSVFISLQYARYTIDASICEGENYFGYTNPGTYHDTLIAPVGCDSIRTLNLTVLKKPRPKLGVDTVLCKGDTLLLFPGQFDSYLWQDGSVQNKSVVRQGGFYSVQVTNTCGIASDEIFVRADDCEIFFPTGFTPNNDGLNDVFKILNAYKVTDFHLRIYNRWGQVVYESKDASAGWTGTFKGKMQDPGVFIWQCNFKRSGVERYMKGTITLIK
ncbi:MAG TPA: gliding motility-associated C-terminal domain-containing protein [Chitinophagaceae bacterium]